MSGNEAPYGPKTDHSQRFPCKLRASETLFFLLHERIHILSRHPGVLCLRKGDPADNIPGSKQHGCGDQFLYGVGVCARRIENRYAPLTARRKRNVVDARTRTRNGRDRIEYVGLLQFMAAQQQRVGVSNILTHLISLALKTVETLGRDRVVGLDTVHNSSLRV